MLYASKSWLENKINTGSVYGYCNIWIARYNDTLGYGSRYDMAVYFIWKRKWNQW